MNRYEMEPILNPIGRFVIYGDHLNAIEELEARVAELETILRDALGGFECTQIPAIYPADHWSNRAICALKH